MRTPARILVADDNPANLDIFQARLTAQGYEVLTANHGEQALELAREALPDLILLDIMMPEMDGYEVTRRIKGNQNTKQIPIV